jgi:MFS transporter, FHS family, glucose/mannose:H+ symporter
MANAATANRSEIAVVYCAAVVQGLALVTFPAASSIFTSPDGFGFATTRYGAMFVPQVVLAILSSALAPQVARRWSLRGVLLVGFAGNIVSMTLLALSRLLIGSPDLAFGVLLVATGALGLGFGATVMALNTYAGAFFPRHADEAVLALNALLGLGTALAPVLVVLVVAAGAWWLLPVALACIMLPLFGIALREPLSASATTAGTGAPTRRGLRSLPRRFWFYATAVFLYGILETLNGNWATLYLTEERGVSARAAAFALAAFWAMVTVGRVLIAVISQLVPARKVYVALPALLLLVFLVSSHVHGEIWAILVFGSAGFACSGFLPLSISFGADEFPYLSAVMAGELIAFYQLGYGVAAFGTGPLHEAAGLAYSSIFAGGSIVAIPLIVIAWFAQRRAV